MNTEVTEVTYSHGCMHWNQITHDKLNDGWKAIMAMAFPWSSWYASLGMHVSARQLSHTAFSFMSNSLRPGDTYMCPWTGISLVEARECRLFPTEPCWYITKDVPWQAPERNLSRGSRELNPWQSLEIKILKLLQHPSGANALNGCWDGCCLLSGSCKLSVGFK